MTEQDQLKTLLTKHLDSLLTWIGDTGASVQTFAAAQIPDILQQKLAYEFWSAVAWLGVGTIMLLIVPIAWIISMRLLKKHQPAMYDRDKYFMAPILITIFVGGSGVVMLLANLDTALKIYFAPKVYIIDWLRGML